MSEKKKKKKTTSKAKAAPDSEKGPAMDGDTMIMFLDRVLQWLQAPMTYGRVVNLFSMFDSDKDNLLSADDFTVAMKMMGVPATRTEVESLINIIDPQGSGSVNIMQFDKIISDYRRKLEQAASEAEDDTVILTGSSQSTKDLVFSPSRVSVKCVHCRIGTAEPPKEKHPRHINLKLTLAPFKGNKSYPGHFEHEVTETTTIHGLKCLIENHLDDSVNSVALFKDSSCSKESYMDPRWCLGHCGIEGGPKDAPKSAEIFYDYFPLNSGCPILMDDSHIPNFII